MTIGFSTYLILYSHPLYKRIAQWLKIFERKIPQREIREEGRSNTHVTDVILFGLGRYGNNIARHLRERGLDVLGVDFNPGMVADWQKQGFNSVCGDAKTQNIQELCHPTRNNGSSAPSHRSMSIWPFWMPSIIMAILDKRR